jgi:DNA-binding HxlR family transcriptional regulator
VKGYGQFCPVAQALEIVGERWTLLVVRELLSGSRRFSEIQRGVPLMSPTLLSQRLARLERAGIVRKAAQGRGAYEVTEAGRELWPVVESLGVWGQRWARRDVLPEHLDPALLMWDVRRRLEVAAMPHGRTVIKFSFRGQLRGQATWWLVVEDGEVDLCLTDPGHPVNVAASADLATMIRAWMGDIPLRAALRSGAITLAGPRHMIRAFPAWLKLNVLATVARPADTPATQGSGLG